RYNSFKTFCCCHTVSLLYKNYFYYLDICTKIDALFNIIKDFSLKVNRKHFLFFNKAFQSLFQIILSYNIVKLKLRLTNTVYINRLFYKQGEIVDDSYSY